MMKRKSVHSATFIIIFAVSPLALTSPNSSSETDNKVTTYPGFELVWADEFNKNGPPDPNKWTYERGLVRNEELQWYQPENARCKNGLLVIEARRQRKANPNYKSGSRDWRKNRQCCEYTSASITTKGLHNWQCGRFEMRGRIDTLAGMWPAFWTLGTKGPWPAGGEIDIMEYYRGMLLANAAWASDRRWVPIWDDVRRPITEFDDPDWSAKFHVWRMDWEADNIKLYVDGMLMNEIDVTRTFNKDREGKNPFRQPHYMILNLAIGGTNGGDPSMTKFPATFEVDCVRVYKKQR
ncbi:MAG: glycoside hydrolase family 16 protein [Phycisphaerales bacterium]|nr:MAG: glycoside hydrolase family 16 protein [Phycisphaerales bacterium]